MLAFFLLTKFHRSTYIHHSVVSEQSTSCCSPYDDKPSPEITIMVHSKHRIFSIYQGFLVVIGCDLLLLCPDSLWIKVPMRVQISTGNTEVLHCNGGPVCQDCVRTTELTSSSNTGKATSNTQTIFQKHDVWDSHSGIDALCRLFPMRRDWKAELKKPSPGPLMRENSSQFVDLCYFVTLRKVALETHLLFNTTKWTANIAT